MNDFDAELDGPTRVPDADRFDAGLLPRDHARNGATFARRPGEESGPTRMYRAVPVRVESAPTTLVVGPWFDAPASRAYRIEAVREVPSGGLATVRFRATDADAE
ncbi:hypothetical protein M0R89_01295 [Halorussus limi]|uniref:Uncharacterized protein n=1 Tax=Halorussus limi TaxID=2938695 RepID=A0A8U0HVI1_9EURY|nr:hypothetical protein [Halorussus limi]UPV74721.1 hypothetical protein M0R89_01295 [Halorussus limi]